MTNRKYKILKKVNESNPTNPVRRSDYYRKVRNIMRNKRDIDELMRFGFIRQLPGCDKLEITPKGILELENENRIRSDHFRESVRYWITTAIALLALAISIVALSAQLGILQLPRY